MAKKIIVHAYPKINLALDILSHTESGLHEIQTIFHEVREVRDEIVLERAPVGVLEVFCSDLRIPVDNTNTIVRAARILNELIRGPFGARISLNKSIPILSGLGGASSDAVAVLKGLTALWSLRCCTSARSPIKNLHAPDCLLRSIAVQVGMDCNFFFDGGTAIGRHFGEVIEPLSPLPRALRFTLIDTGVEVSSREAYESIVMARCSRNKTKTDALIGAIRNADSAAILENIHNDFEEFVFEKHPELARQKAQIEADGSRVLLCGSGGALVKVSQ